MRYETMNRRLPKTDMVDFRTPAYLFSYINSLYTIEYDGACSPGINNLAKPLRLEEEWPQGVIYSNPPFDITSICAWLEKGWNHSRKHYSNVHILLLPNKLTQVKLHDFSHMIDKIIFLGGRVDFDSPHAVKGGTSRMGSIIVIQSMNDSGFDFIKLSELKDIYSNSIGGMK